MVLDNIDYKLLRQQKLVLLTLSEQFDKDSINGEALNGTIALIDALQDEAVTKLGKTEREVFGVTFKITPQMCMVASHFLNTDEVEIEDQLEIIMAQNEVDRDTMIDYLTDVQVVESSEYTFSCKDFIDKIS